MNGPIRKSVVLADPFGLHPRPATAFAQKAAEFQSRVTVWSGDRPANGKNAWDLIMLAAQHGSELTLELEGPDAATALDDLLAVLLTPMND